MSNEDFKLDEIISIDEIEEGDTIDITVEDTHMFYANDIYTHNSGFNSEFIETGQMGGSIKRAQKTHFLMSVAKTPDQKDAGLANVMINKARFAKDGQRFEDVIYDNDSMIIAVNRESIRGRYTNVPKVTDRDINNFNKKIDRITGGTGTKYVNDDSEISGEDEMTNENTSEDKVGKFNKMDREALTQLLNKRSEEQNIKKDK